MTNAVSYFHSAYEGEAFDEQDADVAYQYYTRAMVRIEYIGYVLVGEIPENDHDLLTRFWIIMMKNKALLK